MSVPWIPAIFWFKFWRLKMVDPELPVTRRDQWEEISFEEVGGVENVPRAIVENALRAFVEDAARREGRRRHRSRALRDRNVRLARKRSIGKRRSYLRAKFQYHFRKVSAVRLLDIRRHIKRFVPDYDASHWFPSRHGFAFDYYCALYATWLCQNGLHWYYD
jgi:predicted RNA-binding protein